MNNNALYVVFTMDCEQVGANQGGPIDWSLGERAIQGYCQTLLDHNLTATLFLVPQAAERYYQALRPLVEAGVEVGLHYHPQDHGHADFLGAYTYQQQYEMLDKAVRAWKKAMGQKPKVFRPGNFSANDATFPVLEALGIVAGSVSCPMRNFTEVRANWAGAPLDAHFAHQANRLLAGELNFFEAPLSVDWESIMWGGRTPLELRLEMVDSRAHGFTIRKIIERQIKTGVLPHLVIMTHNVFAYGDPAEFRQQVLSGVIKEIERAARAATLTPRGVTLQELRDRWMQR
jgi:peptidoglycan/xylan/chitin deacetylase (PgdA/CDA1 family)